MPNYRLTRFCTMHIMLEIMVYKGMVYWYISVVKKE